VVPLIHISAVCFCSQGERESERAGGGARARSSSRSRPSLIALKWHNFARTAPKIPPLLVRTLSPLAPSLPVPHADAARNAIIKI